MELYNLSNKNIRLDCYLQLIYNPYLYLNFWTGRSNYISWYYSVSNCLTFWGIFVALLKCISVVDGLCRMEIEYVDILVWCEPGLQERDTRTSSFKTGKTSDSDSGIASPLSPLSIYAYAGIFCEDWTSVGAEAKDNAGAQTPARCGKATKEPATDKTPNWQQLEQLRSCTCEVQQRQVSRRRVLEATSPEPKL